MKGKDAHVVPQGSAGSKTCKLAGPYIALPTHIRSWVLAVFFAIAALAVIVFNSLVAVRGGYWRQVS